MILNGTEDLRIQKTIEAIHNNFEDMLLEMDYKKITVKELTERAKINKKTFYRYYPSMDDLLAEIQIQLSQEYIAKVKDYKLPDELDKVNREFFLYSASKGELYERITCSGNFQFMRQKMISNVMNSTWRETDKIKNINIYKQNILLSFIEASSIEMYRQWVADGKKIPIEEIIDLSNCLISNGINGLFNL